MAKPKKATKVVKNQTPSKKNLNPPPSPPQAPAQLPSTKSAPASQPLQKASPPPPPMASKADRVRAVWKDFYASYYTPAAKKFASLDDDEEDDDIFRDRVHNEWNRRLAEQGLCEEDWDDMTAAEQVVVFDAFFGVECDAGDIASIEAKMKTEPPQPLSQHRHNSSSPPYPFSAPAMSASSSSSSSSSNYATINPSAFNIDADDSEESEFAFFEDGAISTPISPASLSSNNWWTSDSLQTSPSTSPASKPIMVEFPGNASQRVVEDELPGAFPALWTPSHTTDHIEEDNSSKTPSMFSNWISALAPNRELPNPTAEWHEEGALFENGLKALKKGSSPKGTPKGEMANHSEQVDWSSAWKSVQAEAPTVVEKEEEPQSKQKSRGKKDNSRPNDNARKEKAEATKALPAHLRRSPSPATSSTTSSTVTSRDRKVPASRPETKTMGGWKKTETPLSVAKGQTKVASSSELSRSTHRADTQQFEQVDWSRALKTVQQENSDWSDNDEPQTPIVPPRNTAHHAFSQLDLPLALHHASASSSASDEYIGPILNDPLENGLNLSISKSPDTTRMEEEFAEYKIATRIESIRDFHREAVEIEVELAQALHCLTDKTEMNRRVFDHNARMSILRRNKENERRLNVDEERKRRVKEVEAKVAAQRKLDALAQEKQQAMREDARVAELRAKELELKEKERQLREHEMALKRREEEVQRRQHEEDTRRAEEDRRRRLEEIRRRDDDRRRDDERKRREDEERHRHEEKRREEEKSRKEEEERRRRVEDPRKRQMEADEEMARRISQQEEFHRQRTEIEAQKERARKDQLAKEAAEATLRPSDRKLWMPPTAPEPAQPKRQILPSFTSPPTDPSPATSSINQWQKLLPTWSSTAAAVPAPPKMTRAVDPKAPLLASRAPDMSTIPKSTLDEVSQPPKLTSHKSASTSENHKIWLPKPEPMTRSVQMEKSKSTPASRSRTVSDPTPPSPRLGPTKTLPAPKPAEKAKQVEVKSAKVGDVKKAEVKAVEVKKEDVKGGRKRTVVTVEEVPEDDQAVGGGLPADSTALMLSNIEPEAPSLVERDVRPKQSEKENEKHVRWTPPKEAAAPPPMTRPRAGSTAKRAVRS